MHVVRSVTLVGRVDRHYVGIRRMETLVSAAWLVKQPQNVRVVHASWEKCVDYEKAHIPGSVCFDGEFCRDRQSPYKNMLPKPEEFAKYVGERLGIDNDTDVVVYDANDQTPSLMYAARVWYMFRVFGHDRVGVLNGGRARWAQEKLPLTTELTKVTPKKFTAKFRRDLVLSYEDVVERVVKSKELQLVDARGADTFKGGSSDPSGGKTGHIPGAVNIPYRSLMDEHTKLIRDKKQLEELFRNVGVKFDRPLATSCGTAMTATGAALAAFLLGKKDVPVYDGSWFEWSKRAPDEYIAKG